MIEINGHVLMEDVEHILHELRKQLALKGVNRFEKIKKSGNNIMTQCPFHKDGRERNPSFGINKDTGACHCFGCDWAGHISEMVSNCFGYDDFGNYGNKWLLRNFLTVLVENRQPLELNIDRDINTQSKQYVEEAVLDALRWYHPYMYKRKLTDEVIEIFDIGYDKETECITFPIRDIKGNCLFIARRSVKTKYFNYPKDVEKPVYGLYEIYTYMKADPKEVIICESMLDAITCWVYGRYAVALNGLGNTQQFKQLRELPIRKYILATDMDVAGMRARSTIKNNLYNKLVTEYIWNINIAKDINDMTEQYFNNFREVF